MTSVVGERDGGSEMGNDDITVPLLMMQTRGPKVWEALM